MDRDSPAACDEAENRVTRHWLAALRQLGHDIGAALDQDGGPVSARLRAHKGGHRGAGSQRVDGIVVAAEHIHEQVRHMLRGDVAGTNGGVKRVHILVVQPGRHPAHGIIREQPVHRQPAPLHLSGERVAASFELLLAAFFGKPLADLRLRTGRDHEVLPVARRAGALVLRCEDLHPVAIL